MIELALAIAFVAVAAPDAAPSADAILARAKSAARTWPRPPYVAYTVVREDRVDGVPDFQNSYTLRVWCRTADAAALSRRAWRRDRASGPLEFVRPVFDERIDPGPPTAAPFDDLFRPAPATPEPAATPEYPTIASLTVAADLDYAAILIGREGGAYHLRLKPRRDPQRHRLRELWVDEVRFDVTRYVVADHLYETFGPTIPEVFDVRLGAVGGRPVIVAIHGETDFAEIGRSAVNYEVDYRFEDITFPAALPDWYFEPATYRQHIAEAPGY